MDQNYNTTTDFALSKDYTKLWWVHNKDQFHLHNISNGNSKQMPCWRNKQGADKYTYTKWRIN